MGALSLAAGPSPAPSASPPPAARSSPSPGPSPSATPGSADRALPLAPRPVSGSVDRVVEKIEERRKDPCLLAKQKGVPCFPTETTIKGEEVSVRDSLLRWNPNGAPRPAGSVPGDPDMAASRPGYKKGTMPIPVISFDPGCVGKSILKSLKGKNDTYYLYRVRDVHGRHVALYDRELDASTFQGELELLQKIRGECEARAAYLHEQMKERPSPSPIPGPSPR
jgi:hypothetical protein